MNKDKIKFKSPKFNNALMESTLIKVNPTKNVGYFDI